MAYLADGSRKGGGGGSTRNKTQTQTTVLPLQYGIIHLTFVQIIKNIECADHPSLVICCLRHAQCVEKHKPLK